jgi:uncharacterized membrane protein YhaH (DUF805 family)
MNWYIKVLKQYADFSGRARRMEFWMFVLFNTIFAFAAFLIDLALMYAIGVGFIYPLYILAVIVPSLAVQWRRLHDTGRSGWYWLMGFIPLAGPIILLVFYVMDSQPGANQYGPNPKGEAQPMAAAPQTQA